MNNGKITIDALISAGRTKAWDYYTNPDHIVNWNFAADDWCCPSAENDMRVGGKYSARMEAKDGSFGFDFEAVYDEVVPEERFTYTMPDGRVVDVDFGDQGEKTKVTIVFDPESQNSLELQRDGWQAILDNYKNYVESD